MQENNILLSNEYDESSLISHQYKIRLDKSIEQQSLEPFRNINFKNNLKLEDTSFEIISRTQAEDIIKEYEYLRSIPPANIYFFGLFFNVDFGTKLYTDGTNVTKTENKQKLLGGVLVFSHEYSDNTGNWDKYGFEDKLILLSRGVCLWWTPKNTASYFISKACDYIRQNSKYRIITATVDPLAGEVGIIYQSCNWKYVGLMQGNLSESGNEFSRTKILIDGVKYSTKSMRNKLGSASAEVVLKHYPNATFIKEYRKRRYFYFIGSKTEKQKYQKVISSEFKEYPKKIDIINLVSGNCKGIIYKITNPFNGKIYIGQTYRTLPQRICDYKRLKCNDYLKNSFIKYGFENFIFEEIDSTDNIMKLNELEIYYINKYNSTDKTIGYNIEIGGRNKSIAPETRKRMSEAAKGRKQTEEWVNKRIAKVNSEDAKKYGKAKTNEEKKYLSENSPKFWQGKSRDQETIDKIKEAKIKNGQSKQVALYNLLTKEILEIHNSIHDASINSIINKLTESTISRQCKFGLKQYNHELIWTVYKDLEANKEKFEEIAKLVKKK